MTLPSAAARAFTPRERRAVTFDFASNARDGEFEGYASLFNVQDQGGDVVMPGAFRRTLRNRGVGGVKLLFQHDAREPIGVWCDIHEDRSGLYVRGRILDDVVRGRDVLALLRAGALDGLSIGYQVVRSAKSRGGPRRLTDVDLWEISIVTFPLLPQARITRVKRRRHERFAHADAALAQAMRRAAADLKSNPKGE